MRGYSIRIKEPFQRGLRRDSRGTSNISELETCTGLVPTEYGLASPESVSRPLTPTVSWPWPQLLKMDGITILADETAISEVTESGWSTAAITTYDPATPANTKSIGSGGPWHCADFQKAWFLCNGNSTVFRTNRDGYAGNAEKTYVQDAITINTCTAFKGRLVLAGFDQDEFFSSDWQSFWNTIENVTDIGFEPGWENDTNWVWYSSPGGGNMIWPFVQTLGRDGLATNTDYGASRPLVVEWMYRLDHGWAPMPWKGTVYAVLPLGDVCIAYGDYGIAVMTPVTIEGAGGVTMNVMGVRKLASYGIASRGAVAGDDRGHVFVDIGGRLRMMQPNLEIVDLDYEEYFNSFVGTEIVVTKQGHLDEYRISDGTTAYMLNKSGLAAVTPVATSNIFAQGANVVVSSAAAGTSVSFLTPIFNMGREDQKTISRVSCSYQNITSAQVRVHYRYSRNDSFSQTSWYTLTQEGVAFPRIAGIDFKFEFSGTDAGSAKFDEMLVGWQGTDRRYRREAESA